MASAYRSQEDAERVRSWCRTALARWSVPHTSHEVQTSLGRTHVVSSGHGDRVCLYLSGTNFNAATSSAALAALGARFQVYAADLPGQPGLSAAARPADEVAGYAQWVADVLAWVRERHGGARLVVVGHSRGGAVTLSVDPDSVDGIALLSPAGLVGVRPTPRLLRATLPWLLRRNEAGARRLLRYMSGPGHRPAPQAVEWLTLVARACRTTGAPSAYPDGVVSRWRGRNVIVVVGEHDVFFPVASLRSVCRSRWGIEPVVVDGAGHLVVDEVPDRVTELVETLL